MEWMKQKPRRRMPGRDRLLMNPFTKILLTAAEYTSYSRDNFGTFSKLFSPDNGPDDILSINDTINSVREAVARYYTYPFYSVDRYIHVYDDHGEIVPVVMRAMRLKHSLYDNAAHKFNYSAFALANEQVEETYYLSQNPGFPLNETIDDIKEWFYSLLFIELKFTLMSLDLGGVLGPVPFYWDVTVTYGFKSGGGEATYDIKAMKRVSDPLKYGSLKTFTYLGFIIVFLSTWSLWLSLRGLWTNWRFYMLFSYHTQSTKGRYIARFGQGRAPVPEWQAISYSVKSQFFNLWNLTCAIGNILLILACVISLSAGFSGTGVAEWNNVLFGIGSFLACINLVRYLEYYERFYTLLRTVRFSLGRVAGFILSVAPIYFGYALLGIICFSQYTDYFVDLDTSSVTIFSLINGDSILDAFNELDNHYPYPWLTRLYLYTMISFFVLSVLNIFIFLIEDAYQTAKDDREGTQQSAPDFGIRELFDALETESIASGRDNEEDESDNSLLELRPQRREATRQIEELLAENERLMREEMQEAMERIHSKYAMRLRNLVFSAPPPPSPAF